jgi:putative SOS response-associated peptidase YedK
VRDEARRRHGPQSRKPAQSVSPYRDAQQALTLFSTAGTIDPVASDTGLWENWRSSAGEWVRSFAIITTTPNELCAELHNRMPVVLGREAWPAWLGEEPSDTSQLKAMLAPFPSEEMTCWPVSARVGNVKNNDPSLIEPIALV